MTRDRDEFEGIDISGPWGGVRIGAGGFRSEDWDDDAEVRAVRRQVRRRLDFLKNLAFFVLITGGLALLDWATGGDWWVQWLAIIWGAFLAMQFLSTFMRRRSGAVRQRSAWCGASWNGVGAAYTSRTPRATNIRTRNSGEAALINRAPSLACSRAI